MPVFSLSFSHCLENQLAAPLSPLCRCGGIRGIRSGYYYIPRIQKIYTFLEEGIRVTSYIYKCHTLVLLACFSGRSLAGSCRRARRGLPPISCLLLSLWTRVESLASFASCFTALISCPGFPQPRFTSYQNALALALL